MPDRLVELLRQRALIQEHLAWLDREIAAVSNQPDATPGLAPTTATVLPAPLTSAPASTVPVPNPLAATSPIPAGRALPPPDADAIIEQYRSSPGSLQSEVRKGCFLYCAAALVLLGLGVVALSFLISSR